MNNNIRIVLAGNPNCGKTTIFNKLTGSRQHVGNYSGVTVEKKEGVRKFEGRNLSIVDLPGTYSLTAYSQEEIIARNYIVEEQPDVVVDVLDTPNLERNLYLASQLLELARPLVLALNMADVAETSGLKLDLPLLEEMLGVKVVRTIGSRNKGMEELLRTVVKAATQNNNRKIINIDYGSQIEAAIIKVEHVLKSIKYKQNYDNRWLAIKLLENDSEIIKYIEKIEGGSTVLIGAKLERTKIIAETGEDPELIIVNCRYRFVSEIYHKILLKERESRVTLSDRIDSVLTNRLLAIPIFLGIMWAVFNLVFVVGSYPQQWIRYGITLLTTWLDGGLPGGELKSLLVDGIIGGVGNVVVFLPSILLLFLAIALLEDTGYMARAAFIMDRVMQKVGLHGKSFIPLLLGFGCSVPAIMGTRLLENPRDRIVTILVAPFMSCSARLPAYTLLIAAFFSGQYAGTVLFSIYLLGVLLAIIMARVLRSILFTGSTEPFVMEMPPYRMPTINSIIMHMWERSLLYLQKAGTLILAVSIIVWFATNYPINVSYTQDYDELNSKVQQNFEEHVKTEIYQPLNIADIAENQQLNKLTEAYSKADSSKQLEGNLEATDLKLVLYAKRYLELKSMLAGQIDQLEKVKVGEKLEKSYAGLAGKVIEPIMKPLGFNWKMDIGLIAGLSAKELLVSSLGAIYNIGKTDKEIAGLQNALTADPDFNPLVAYTLMIFILVYAPCLATLAIIKRETNSWKWPLFSFIYSTVLAWVLGFIIYQGGLIIGLGG